MPTGSGIAHFPIRLDSRIVDGREGRTIAASPWKQEPGSYPRCLGEAARVAPESVRNPFSERGAGFTAGVRTVRDLTARCLPLQTAAKVGPKVRRCFGGFRFSGLIAPPCVNSAAIVLRHAGFLVQASCCPPCAATDMELSSEAAVVRFSGKRRGLPQTRSDRDSPATEPRVPARPTL